jgi:hypothetical protein
MPMTSAPLAAASAATTDESTPPDIATTMRLSLAGFGKSNNASGVNPAERSIAMVMIGSAPTRVGGAIPVI